MSLRKGPSLGVYKPEIRKNKTSISSRLLDRIQALQAVIPDNIYDLANPQEAVMLWQYSQETVDQKLEFAASYGLNQFLEQLIYENNIDVNQTGVLYSACLGGHYETARILVNKYKANVNHSLDSKETPLFGAIFSGNVNLVEFLLNHNADVNLKGRFHSETPLHLCFSEIKIHAPRIDKNQISIMRLLLQRGADINVPHELYGSIPESIKKLELSSDLQEELNTLLSKTETSIDELSQLLERHTLDPDKDMMSLLAAFSILNLESCKNNTKSALK